MPVMKGSNNLLDWMTASQGGSRAAVGACAPPAPAGRYPRPEFDLDIPHVLGFEEEEEEDDDDDFFDDEDDDLDLGDEDEEELFEDDEDGDYDDDALEDDEEEGEE